ncbi:type IVa secretion system protein TapY2 [Aeromonas veronii]|uniref:type IVa secretion system protein TapY2 n=1 Tax=Aeromonas TaxID=642 RepID=UPI00123C587C|nr:MULTISPECIES: type IVa secretion system protein TapY2 [Aeromonas]EKP0293863.1 type IVa secretion system protein TapY2 [Aeromonas veronii]MBJ7581504.1 type IVa secretion system protein TapY2 [Aeromonas veronii]MBJ7589063.1 type IVa secretion system protein TapY2 [Aeromonas veronii]MCX0435337.1 type IVa secretion system protein TapY2 [Aeromonas veronii]MEB5669211.1 type IVa secretion system protein TapY2 [Aeromonas veronii]
MKRMLLWCVGLPLLVNAQTEDIKCYVTLEGGVQMVLQQPVADTSKANLVRVFKQKGYEIDGVVHLVTEVIECVPLAANFSLADAKKQDEIQPR